MHKSNHLAVCRHLWLHGVAQFGGVLGVTLAVNQPQRGPLVVLDDVGDAAEILQENKGGGEVKTSLKSPNYINELKFDIFPMLLETSEM